MIPRRSALGICMFGCFAFISVSSVHAEQAVAQRDEPRREIELRVVHATPALEGETAVWVDPRLEVFRGKIRRCAKLQQFSRYRQIKSVVQRLAVNERGSVLVTERHQVEIVPTAFIGSRTELRVRVLEQAVDGATIEMEAQTHPDGAFLIGPVQHRGGTLLVIIRQVPE